ncbi:hypothetical protein B5807_04701 [Epicoccum nigrum]|uniref:Uncharacterized protein n=1 Tax=Epicoccum nigrum TaxID=105696 RepID=A0A1Y2M5P0_EPING|nr:hypothetical protein B5807_04701 [Epicoccum nigrum]
MVPSPRKRLASPRKRLPPTPFTQTWHETDTAHLDPSALPVARIPRGWERKREVKQVSDGKAKSIWRRIGLRTSTVQDDGTEEEDHEAQSRAVKRRQRMSPKAMEKMRGKKRGFQGTQWDRSKSALPRKRSARTSDASNNHQSDSDSDSDSDDAQDMTDADADMSHDNDSLAEAPYSQEGPTSFSFAVDALHTDHELHHERPEGCEDGTTSGNTLPEDSTFALIFKSPVKAKSAPLSMSPAKFEEPSALLRSHLEQEHLQVSSEHLYREEITVTGPTVESLVAEVVASVTPPTKYVSSDEKMSAEEVHHTSVTAQEHDANMEDDESNDGDITEASLQLDIQDEYDREGELAPQPTTPTSAPTAANDITDGLTLGFTPAKASSREHTPKKLHSPPPPLRLEVSPEDATMTLAIDDDTAILKSFLSRAAASKAERSAIITRRSSLENRRDSDIVRHALASPRTALEEKDPNSPTKTDSDVMLDSTETAATQAEMPIDQTEGDDAAEAKAERGARRSSRAKKSRLPAPTSTAQPQTNKIAIRRADGTDPVILKKTDAQELALITRNNTRKNKQGAFMVSLRLLKLQAEAILSPETDVEEEKPPAPGRRGIRWDETLAYYQEHADSIVAQQAEAESLATPDELSLPAPAATKKAKAKTSADKSSTPKIRRVRTTNGTPGKGLLASCSLLPDAVQDEKTAAASQPAPAPAPTPRSIPKPKSASKKLPVPSATASAPPSAAHVAALPSASEPAKPERKSRIAAPKSVRLPKPVSAAAPAPTPAVRAEKENARTGISGATPRKGIPAPRVVAPKAAAAPAPAVGVESGLPRRRGRKA